MMGLYGLLGALFRPLGWLRGPEYERDRALRRELKRRHADPGLLPIARMAAKMLPAASNAEMLNACRPVARKLGFDNNIHLLRAVMAAKAVAGRRE